MHFDYGVHFYGVVGVAGSSIGASLVVDRVVDGRQVVGVYAGDANQRVVRNRRRRVGVVGSVGFDSFLAVK